MNKILLIFCMLFTFFFSASGENDGTRKIISGEKTEKWELFHIVTGEKKNRIVEYAAKELSDHLEKTLGKKIENGTRLLPGRINFLLGKEACLKYATDAPNLPPEGFRIWKKGEIVCLYGRDSNSDGPGGNKFGEFYERGTLNAVYDFLERFAGVRFYFPGEYGTVIQKKDTLELPENIDILDRPDFSMRKCSHQSGLWYEKNDYDGISGYNLNYLRLRLESDFFPLCHGLMLNCLIERFAKSKPEFFALRKDGKRYLDKSMRMAPQLCFSNRELRETIYQDVKSFLTGKSPESRSQTWRGRTQWNPNFARGSVVGVMPPDSIYWCYCGECAKIAEGGQNYKKDNAAISKAVWDYTFEIAERLKKENIPGYISQMAYFPYNLPPERDIPDNIIVILALPGPDRKDQRTDDDILRKWCKKTKGSLFVWTYPGKHLGKKVMTGIPAFSHKHTGNYFSERRKEFRGAYLESETDYYLFNYLQYYVFAKVTWNTKTDLNSLLSEHYRLMFGKSAEDMKKIYDEFERLWCEEIIGEYFNTSYGPAPKLPDTAIVWMKIYSQEKLNEFANLFNTAEKKVADDEKSLTRVRFIRKNIFDPLVSESRKTLSKLSVLSDWKIKIGETAHLLSVSSDECDVKTTCTVTENKEDFIFTFDCGEPRMKETIRKCMKNNDSKIWSDSRVEIFLNPSGDRKNYYQLAVNPNGAYTGFSYLNGKRSAWNPQLSVKTKTGEASWLAVVKIRKNSLEKSELNGFPVNISRSRLFLSEPAKSIDYQWNPLKNSSFHAIGGWGMLMFDSIDKNILKDSTFNTPVKGHASGAWCFFLSEKDEAKQNVNSDSSVFLKSGRSLRLKNCIPGRINVYQYVKLEPDKKYRYSYYLKLKNVRSEKEGIRGYIFIDGKRMIKVNSSYLCGSSGWMRFSVEFKTPKNFIQKESNCSFVFRNADGKAWIDCVKLEEI